MMRQYMALKMMNEEHLLFYRMGDFYELFFDDAIKASKVLNLFLTKRGTYDGKDIPMCGVPAHSSNVYLLKLIKSGFSVAICEQLETPQEAKKRGYNALVRRDVTRIITPGTILEDELLESKNNNYLCSLYKWKDTYSIALTDLSVGEFKATSFSSFLDVEGFLAQINVAELLAPESLRNQIDKSINLTARPENMFDINRSGATISAIFNESVLTDNFSEAEIIAIGSLLEYIRYTQKDSLPFLSRPSRHINSNFMVMDKATRRNLEIEKSLSGERSGSLLGELDMTLTAAGSRLMCRYFSMPLIDPGAINARLDDIEFFIKNKEIRGVLRDLLSDFPDLERALQRSIGKLSSPYDLNIIRKGLETSTIIVQKIMLSGSEISDSIRSLIVQIAGFEIILKELKCALAPEECTKTKDSHYIRYGYSKQLDCLLDLLQNTDLRIEELQDKYRKITGVNNLKISKNNIIGYFVEVSSANSNKLKSDIFIHKQSLGNSIRYFTDELKNLENLILNNTDKVNAVKDSIFDNLKNGIIKYAMEIGLVAGIIAKLDVLSSMAQVAVTYKYIRPIVDHSGDFYIEEGRHPVVEVHANNVFVPNNCDMNEKSNLWLITGPNMAGKSTFLRQNALICLMAQAGSFVPATYAKIGAIDKLFCRIGAADNLHKNHSTFMVEMLESSNIVNNASNKSLIIMDEIGRGTSTNDGIAIATAIIEYIHDKIKARAFFATHYHELACIEERLERVSCHTMDIKEWDGEIVFLHKIKNGRAEKSYGVHVARLAGLPNSIIDRANELLELNK